MREVTIFVFVVIVVAAISVEIYARFAPSKLSPLNAMLSHIMHSRITRVGITAAWWWFGWHFLFGPTVQLEL